MATFNVHCFTDARGRCNINRIKQMIQEHKPDILCLQEATKTKLAMFGYSNVIYRGNCAILTNLPLKQMDCHKDRSKSSKPRYVIGQIHLDASATFYITCLHLNHALERKRKVELEQIFSDIQRHELTGTPTIFTGDFNALTRADYSESEWSEIGQIRSQNLWEECFSEITDKMRTHCTDAKVSSQEFSGPLSTCRFHTRIDYIYLNPCAQNIFEGTSLKHIDQDTSDHNMVVAKLKYHRKD